MSLLVERSADRGNSSVHHVAWRDRVGACVDVADGGAREHLQRLVVVDLIAVEDAAMPV